MCRFLSPQPDNSSNVSEPFCEKYGTSKAKQSKPDRAQMLEINDAIVHCRPKPKKKSASAMYPVENLNPCIMSHIPQTLPDAI